VVYPLVRLGQSVRRTTRRSQEALEHMSHVSAEAFSGHRIVKAFGAEGAKPTSSRRLAPPLSHQHARDERAERAAAAHGVHGRPRVRRRAVDRQSGDLVEAADAGRLPDVHHGALHDVCAGQEAESRQRQHPAGAGGVGRIFDILDTHSEVEDRAGRAAGAPFRRAIEFRDVQFAYAAPRAPRSTACR
jgi:ABC-type multidrug transport system fused ATPase/permease subunit